MNVKQEAVPMFVDQCERKIVELNERMKDLVDGLESQMMDFSRDVHGMKDNGYELGEAWRAGQMASDWNELWGVMREMRTLNAALQSLQEMRLAEMERKATYGQ